MPTTKYPVRKYKNDQASKCNRCVVKCLNRYWVGNRQWEEDGYDHHPNNCNPPNNDSITTQVERPWNKILSCQGHPKEDGKSISNV